MEKNNNKYNCQFITGYTKLNSDNILTSNKTQFITLKQLKQDHKGHIMLDDKDKKT
jgi:hypothetical protein